MHSKSCIVFGVTGGAWYSSGANRNSTEPACVHVLCAQADGVGHSTTYMLLTVSGQVCPVISLSICAWLQ